MGGRSLALSLLGAVAAIVPARAGDAGLRDFPATLVAEEPQVETEIAPQAGVLGYGEGRRTDLNADLAVQFTETFGGIVNPDYTFLRPGGQGFQALEVGAKYQFVANAPHEIVLSAAVLATLGGVGSRIVEADSYTSVVPTVFYGKGAGDLPEALAWARPFALTGQVGLVVPTRRHTRGDDAEDGGSVANPFVVSLEGSLQYSLPYLSRTARDGALGGVLADLVPLVEYDLEIPVANRGGARLPTVGTINPGVLWIDEAHGTTWGLEALIPINRASGTHPGVRLQLSYSFRSPFLHGTRTED